jgi:geranylgeranyl diphosphate synthase, type II
MAASGKDMVATDTTVFREYAATVRGEIDAALQRWTTYDQDCPPALQAAIRHSLLAPGKRLRPLLVLMAAEACGGGRGQALPAACAVEMIHTYSLIHDDLPAMDDDDLRRGQPACHVKFGEALAILAGDALLAQAFEVLASGIQPPALAARCCRELAWAAGASALVGGQVDDLDQTPAPQREVAQLERIHRRKTGAMFVVSLRLGGLIGGADDRQLAALETYGRSLGLAFQIVDDLLDIQGDQRTLGKTVGKDDRRGKATFPALLGIAASRQRAADLIRAAQAAVEPLGERAGRLASLADYVLERNR